MTKAGMSYDQALAQATELGFAEADPTADVEGYDAGRKIAIMASIAFHSRVTFGDVYTEGITKITKEDIELWFTIRYLAPNCTPIIVNELYIEQLDQMC